MNFIDPQYTAENPYIVTVTPGYEENKHLTETLKKSSINNIDELINSMFDIYNENNYSKEDIQITIVTDDQSDNEMQMALSYDNQSILIETSADGIIKKICHLICEHEGVAYKNNQIYDKKLITTYSGLKDLYTVNSEWETNINKLIKKKDWTWTSNELSGFKTDTTTTTYVPSDTTPLKWGSVVYSDMLKIANKSGYQNGTNKDGGQGTRYLYWELENNENLEIYKLTWRPNYPTTNAARGNISSITYTLVKTSYNPNSGSLATGTTKVSTSYELQKTISTWYKALRAIALVGLLSVLVYVGIRILISSTGQEKAKYKKMIVDWVTAICILFVLQYIMVFILEITQKITDILRTNAIGANGEDLLMSNLRNKLGTSDKFSEIFAELLMYLVLVIYTVMFTIQYLKRVVYMAFFTMIAPLIALTYPLDKIKDGQAQAFTTWIREYIFNALLQPMHLLLYVIFVSSAMDLVGANPLYAIVAIGFLLPAEKFFRKMFGFDKASSSNQLGAAAGGALIMNAINKMGHSSGKKAAGSSGGSGDSGSSSAPRYVAGPADASGGNDIHNANQSAFDGDGSIEKPPDKVQSNGRLNGAMTLGGHYINSANGRKIAKGLGRTARKVGVGAVGAATLGTVGLAAGIATGDPGNAVKYGLTGGAAGYMGANNLGDKATAFEKTNREIFQEGRYGTAEYNTRKSISELTGDNDFNKACKQTGQDSKQLIRQFHTNGITSSADIKKSVSIMAQTGATPAEIITAQRLNQEAKKYGMKRKDIEERLNKNNNIDTNTMLNLIDKL